jgi:hypothetical protein
VETDGLRYYKLQVEELGDCNDLSYLLSSFDGFSTKRTGYIFRSVRVKFVVEKREM